MPEVLVLGVVGLAVYLQRHIVRFCVLYLLLAGLDAPLTPGSDDRHIRCKVLNGKLEAYLVVALTRAAVADGIRALLLCDIDKCLRDARTCMAGTEQILLVYRARLHGRNDVVVNIVVGKIEDIELGGTGLECLLLQTVKLVCLTDVTRDRDDLAIVVVLLQPRNNDRCIKSARICKNNLLDICLFNLCRCFHFIYHPFARARSARRSAVGLCMLCIFMHKLYIRIPQMSIDY